MVRLITFTLLMTSMMLASCIHTKKAEPGAELLTAIPAYGAAPLIRVKLDKPSQADTLQWDGGKAWIALDGRRSETSGKITIRHEAGRLFVDGRPADTVELTPMERPEHFTLDDRIYRGRLRVLANTSGWDVVNVVDLEQYVAGVIGWEMISGWPVEALKAQAVASRTYAVFEMESARASGRHWDVDDTTLYQVYGGVGPVDKPKWWRESAAVLQAREQTNGQVLTWQGKGFRAFFHSTSGGHTVNPAVGLGVQDEIPPLRGVDLGEFGKDSPKHRWEMRIPDSDLRNKLIRNRIEPFDLLRIARHETAPSGHAQTLRLYDRSGKFKLVSAVDVRRALGLYSTNFSVERMGDEWVFNGRGYGHGCGMCQWSARGMAAAGWNAQQILDVMYPGSRTKTLY